ncbi:MAG: hypothetical protein D6732_28820 [Methanobacteriota archaeon]|nr:MAG: hypothetical protein D6732_28820 [Euryarchaeota archaeon]
MKRRTFFLIFFVVLLTPKGLTASTPTNSVNPTYSANFPLLDGALSYKVFYNITTTEGANQSTFTMETTWQAIVESVSEPNATYPRGLEKITLIQTFDWVNFIVKENGVLVHNITDFKLRLVDSDGNFIRDLQVPSFSIDMTMDKEEKNITSVSSEADEYHIVLLENNEEFTGFGLFFTPPPIGQTGFFFAKTKDVEVGDEIPELGTVKKEKTEDGLRFFETEMDSNGARINALIEKSTGLIVDQNISLSLSSSFSFTGRMKLTSGLDRVDNAPPEVIDLSKNGTRGINVHAEDEALQDYEIYLNGTLVRSGNFNSTISDTYFDLGIDEPKIYEVRLVVRDAFGHTTEMTEIIDFHEEKSNANPLPIAIIFPISAIVMIVYKRNKN